MEGKWQCPGCLKIKHPLALKSRCLTQIQVERWTGYCIRCCCVNNIRGKDCSDPGYQWWLLQ